MNRAHTAASRHHDYIGHLVVKLERRCGSDEEVLAPLLEEMAHIRQLVRQDQENLNACRIEPSGRVVHRFWTSRTKRMKDV